MKIHMSSHVVTFRLKQANELRRACLALANSSATQSIRNKYAANRVVQRTSKALGR
jgi:hypothetical protein